MRLLILLGLLEPSSSRHLPRSLLLPAALAELVERPGPTDRKQGVLVFSLLVTRKGSVFGSFSSSHEPSLRTKQICQLSTDDVQKDIMLNCTGCSQPERLHHELDLLYGTMSISCHQWARGQTVTK